MFRSLTILRESTSRPAPSWHQVVGCRCRPVRAGAAVVGGERCSSLYRLLVGGHGRWEFAPVAHLPRDRQAARGSVAPLVSEGLVAGEHVPDRFGEPAGEIDLCDFGAALFADAR